VYTDANVANVVTTVFFAFIVFKRVGITIEDCHMLTCLTFPT